MTIRIWERPGSGKLTEKTLTKLYGVSGTTNESTVMITALQYLPLLQLTINGVMVRQQPECSVAAGASFWDVNVGYALDGSDEDHNSKQPGQWSFKFSNTGGTVHIKAGKATVQNYTAAGAGTAPNEHDLIGHHEDEVDGTDIVIPAAKLTISYRHPAGIVNLPFCWAIDDLTGCVNSTTMFGRPAGEILFLGLDMSASLPSAGATGETTLDYSFARSKNLTNQVVDAINGITKKGWHVLWIAWKDSQDGANPVKIPKAVYVNRVYDEVDLKAALGFG